MPLPEMHGRTHCPTGSDPIPIACLSPGATTAAFMHEIDFDNIGDENVAAATWELVCDGSNGRHFTEGWRLDGDWGMDFDGAGTFSRADFALYEAWISLQFGNGTDGDTIGVAVQLGTSVNFFHTNLIVLAGGVTRVQASAQWWSTLSAPGVRFWCYASAVRAITRCEVSARMFELSDSGEIIDFP